MINRLAAMCKDANFDRKQAEMFLQQIDVNQEFVDAEHGFKTVLLDWAATWSNVSMAKLLLDNGADPNHVYDNGSENVLWNLQYADKNAPMENQRRLEIVKLLLEKSANPHLRVEGEDLYYWTVMCHIELDEGEQWDYREEYIRLLEEYGA